MIKSSQDMEINKTKDQRLKAYCSQCSQETNHTVLQSVDPHGSEEVVYTKDQSETFDWVINYQIIQCQGCDMISFRHHSWLSGAEQQIGPDEWDDGSTTTLFPKRSDKTKPIKGYFNAPYTLRRIYRETIECYKKGVSPPKPSF